ncbi:MAG: beta-N-acetylhexosaminidase [Clostridia bacterium]|nr:beta-N-acetylhexosaminidase [Clostridia bacterium]
MKINLICDESLKKAVDRLCNAFDFTLSEAGVTVNAVCGDKLGASFKNNVGTVYYTTKNQFFRELILLIDNLKNGNEFEIYEDRHFKTVGTMVDVSRCAAPTVETVCTLIDYLATMGYNMLMLYTEDMIKLEDYPYFGYMRGRYTEDELRAIDDYAYGYGIEVVPCIECYGHMEKYLLWHVAYPIRDTETVMLAREDATFELIEKIISTTSRCFRSRRIHVGMDEAWDMGRGRFLDKHGYVPPAEIFNEYMQRLMGIINKYSLSPMMWSDMYFRTASESGFSYYDVNTVITEEIKEQIPKEMELVFWHYGEGPGCDEKMLMKHKALDRRVMFAGGTWSWIGHFPEHNYAFETTRDSILACRKTGVDELLMTIWGNDNAECDLFANLLDLSFTAEMCYNVAPDQSVLRKGFERCTGGDFDAFYNMSAYHNIFDEHHIYSDYHSRFLGKPLFWQDVMEGLYDYHLFQEPRSGHYKLHAEKMSAYDGKWSSLYSFATLVFGYLAIKCEIAEKAVPAYKGKDRSTLEHISQTLLPRLREATQKVHSAHKELWFAHNKIIGWQNMDIRYGGVVARIDTAKMLIDAYLTGKSDTIEEFEEERLYKVVGGFAKYSSMATVNIRI